MAARQRAYFTVSFDFELIWGTLDLFGVDGFRRACGRERDEVIERTLALLDKYAVPGTWFVVGHLMLDRCDPGACPKHPDIVRPRHGWTKGDWFDRDPGGDEGTAPLFFARTLVEKIRCCPTAQEIGCHSFSHVIFGDEGCSEETAESDVRECVRAAGALGLELRAFAFPRNRVGHLAVLARHNFSCYRGPEPRWYAADIVPRALARLAHLTEFALAVAPPVVWPRQTAAGLHDVPGSMVYLPRHGVRRLISVARRVRRASRGLEAAVRSGGLFHLWMHPTNLAEDTESMLGGLERIFARAAELRDSGRLEFATVSQMASIAAGRDDR